MGAEQMEIIPSALELSYGGRIVEHVLTQQYKAVGRNLVREGIIAELGPGAEDAPWDAYQEVMDGIVTAKAEITSTDAPYPADLSIGFKSVDDRARFRSLNNLMMAGIHGLGMPDFYYGTPRELRAENYTYPEVVTLGRVGTVFLREQYGKALGHNLRLVLHASINEIYKSGADRVLPQALREQMEDQRERLGGKTLLSSGNISIIGTALRKALKEAKITELPPVQRPRGQRPYVESGAKFKARAKHQEGDADGDGEVLPMSTMTVGGTIVGQVGDKMEDFSVPFKRRDVTSAAEALRDLVFEFGAKEGAVALVRALGTAVIANVVALWGRRVDGQMLEVLERQADRRKGV